MARFFLKTISFFALGVFLFEIIANSTSPIFSLRQFYFDVKNLAFKTEENKVIKTDSILEVLNEDGELVSLRINNIGYYSHRDFDASEVESSVYVIGDSFVESKGPGTFNSIGFYLETELDSIKVVSFGKGGWNVHNYNSVYRDFNMHRAKHVIMVITGINDLLWQPPFIKKEKYLNLGFVDKLKITRLFTRRLNSPSKLTAPNYDFLLQRENIIYVIHDNLPIEAMQKVGFDKNVIEVNLNNEYRMSDGHFNSKGNDIIANQISYFISNEN